MITGVCLLILPKTKLIRPTVLEEFGNIQTNTQTEENHYNSKNDFFYMLHDIVLFLFLR